jgi:hypothetical protein
MKKEIFVWIIFFSAFCCQLSAQNELFIGVWKIVKVMYNLPDGVKENSDLLPSQIMFTKNHYSFIQYPRKEMQKNYTKGWYPSDEEKVESYNSIIVNGGKYNVENGILITKPEVAKTPNFVGGFAKYEYSFKEGKLFLTLLDLQSNDSVQDTAALSIKTILVLERLE